MESVCLLCALGAAVAARWLWPGRSVPAVAAGCGTLVGSAVCFAAGEENGVQTILFCGGDALLAAMKGQIFESPRGKVFIDAQTRDIVQDVYLRKVERVNGQLYNVEFDVIKDVKDPGKTK